MRKLFRLLLPMLLLCAASLPAQARFFRTVIIDPGHGGHDKGGQWGQVYEKHLALDTSVRLESELKKRGFRTVMTRRSDYFISLPERVRIASRYSDAIFVSVHYNYTWKQQVSGLETFYHSGQSQALASYVHSGMMSKVRAVNRGVKFARFYVIRNTTCPSILVECGFVSNAGERSRMKTAWFRQALAEGMAEGIARFRRSG
ncbi:N-acetylmuramoyl-L-alanine amidase [Luteolibacter flavescens]|uniref:N-acetylmuramoyl-L-alanine amidase n=1 Tax=Luteolibacter flavescens TaxID=1859460 RepID=A0ABT3FVF4_9BACT|nr:N-acetylmuramoyl-L-alanine amidase [Luteolibacter flavescens]MCW1887578.1 N-acetylmuramoyl-L-alanine amidase [Luteolibacter flavescens]